VKVFTAQEYVSENKALSEVIDDAGCIEGNVVVFDRGLTSRRSFDRFTDSNKLFVGRAHHNIRYKVEKSKKVTAKPKGSTLTIVSDDMAILSNKKGKKTRYPYRIIKGSIDKSGEEICFITNMLEEDCYRIAQLYKQRWEIESFFKFIKQHLNVKHLVSRDENGIKVMIYMTMIVSVLILAYKKINNIQGFKIARLRFEIELENEIIKTIVMLCGGDPNKAAHYFSSA
jgi:transposase